MNAAHIHLILNHFPIAGMIFSLPLLVFSWWRNNEAIGRTGLIGVLFTGILTIPTFLTGEPSEKTIEHLPGVSEKLIKLHEEAAEKAIWFIGAAVIAALVTLFLAHKKKSIPQRGILAVMVLSTFSVVVLAWSNNLGGEIRHTEIRNVPSYTSDR